ncbi:hypothetical protein [Dubosiella newyorkensis]|uniref:hypothetical protein n=1 Tax=Dubosiella newyorkensis TaxID=1862672 RepID=UPI0032B28828
MGSVINCKIKGIKKNHESDLYRMITSYDENLYVSLETLIEDHIPYNCKTLIEDRQWFYIENLSEQPYAIEPAMNDGIGSTDLKQISEEEIKQIDYFFIYESNLIFFQNFRKSAHIRKKLIYQFGQTYRVLDTGGFTLNPVPDAIYNPSKDILFFRKLESIATIFKGIESLYKEATDEEVKEFLENDFIQLDNGYGVEKVKKMNRKRIALIKDSLNKLSHEEKKQLLVYIGTYVPNLKEKKEKVTIENEQDLKMLLYGLEQRFYTTPVDDEKRLANSIIKLE